MLKRFIAFLLTFAVIVCAFSSCDLILGKDYSAVVEAADAALDTTEHTVNISVSFSSTNEELKKVISSLDASEIKMVRKGNDFKIDLAFSLGDDNYSESYIIVGNDMYHSLSYRSDSVKQKATIMSGDKAKVVAAAGAGAILSCEDFENVTMESSSTVNLITCKQIKADSKETLVEMFLANFDGLAESVSVSDAELSIRILEGKYNGMYLSCTYEIVIGGVSYDVKMQSVREYDITTPVSVEIPEDASEYSFVTYSEIIK